MKMDKEGERRRAGERVGEGKKKNYPRGAGRKRGMTGGKKTEMLECASKKSFVVICGQFVTAFFLFFFK